MDLQDQGVIDSRCSRYMKGNMSYLTNYEEIDGGYVSFKENLKGGKITGKAKRSIRGSNHGLPRWQSVCSLNDPTVKIEEPMIARNEGFGSNGESNKLEDLEASFSGYKYKHPSLTPDVRFVVSF
ncbi:hypothetical protein Tco_1085929 [Tanacetum coccineum]